MSTSSTTAPGDRREDEVRNDHQATGNTAWERYLTDSDEGLGTVYERFVMNDILVGYRRRFGFERALEAPVYGMTGITGINGAALVQDGCRLTLVDTDRNRAGGQPRIWEMLGIVDGVESHAWSEGRPLPFADASFPFAFNFAALWHLADADTFLAELARVSSQHVWIAMPNPLQIGYVLRKRWLEPEFFTRCDERWSHMPFVKERLRSLGLDIVEEGVFDVPPWPDTCLPIGELLARLGLARRPDEPTAATAPVEAAAGGWSWSIVGYYRDGDQSVKKKVDLLRWGPESWPLPWRMKLVWAHHRYVLAERRD